MLLGCINLKVKIPYINQSHFNLMIELVIKKNKQRNRFKNIFRYWDTIFWFNLFIGIILIRF